MKTVTKEMLEDLCEHCRDYLGEYRADTISPITTKNTIRANHPIRNEFSSHSVGNENASGTGRTDYYSTKSVAVNAFDGALQGYDLCLDRNDLDDFHGDAGRKIILIRDGFDHPVGCAVLMWHRMQSGRWEFIGYIS